MLVLRLFSNQRLADWHLVCRRERWENLENVISDELKRRGLSWGDTGIWSTKDGPLSPPVLHGRTPPGMWLALAVVAFLMTAFCGPWWYQ